MSEADNKMETKTETKTEPVESKSIENKKERKQRQPRRRGPKDYRVSVPAKSGNSVLHVSKSGPKSATSHAVRSLVKSLPLREDVKVWTKSRSKYHPFIVKRDYDTQRHKRFTIARAGPSVAVKQATTTDHGIPAELLP